MTTALEVIQGRCKRQAALRARDVGATASPYRAPLMTRGAFRVAGPVTLALQDLEAFRFQWVARITGMIVAPGVASGRYKGQTALGRAMASPFKSLAVAQGAIG